MIGMNDSIICSNLYHELKPMRCCCYFISVWLLVLHFYEAKAQGNSILKDLRMVHVTMEQGLASNVVTKIIQDSKGFMWFVTSNGLNRYDGYDFKFYDYNAKDPNSFAPGWFNAAIDHKNGLIWMSCYDFRELYSFNPATEKFVLYRGRQDPFNSVSNDPYHAIASDSLGTLWLAGENGLNSYDPKTRKVHLFSSLKKGKTAISCKNIIQIEKDSTGNFWLLSKENNQYQIDYFDPYKNRMIEHITGDSLKLPPDQKLNPLNYVLNIGRNGNLWIGSDKDGLYRYNVHTKKIAHFVHLAGNPYTLSSRGAHFVLEARSGGRLWIITSDNKLEFYDSLNRKFYPVPSFTNADGYFVRQLFEDKNGNIWIATQQDGIYLFSPFQKKIHIVNHDASNANSLASNIAICTFQTSNGQLLFGTDKGVTIFNKKNGQTKPFEVGGNIKETDHVVYIYEDRQGVIWLCSWGGLLSYDPATKKRRWYRHRDGDPNSLNDARCNGIIQDTKGRYWITAFTGGFESFEPASGKFHSIKIEDGHTASPFPVGNLIQSSNGDIYIGSWGGGFVIFNPDKKTFKIYRHNAGNPASVSNDFVYDYYESKNGIIWLCTDGGGLNAFDPVTKKFRAFTSDDGLCNDGVISITADNKGNLWLGTMNGISCFAPPDNPFSPDCKIQFRNYDVSDGLPSNQMYYCTAYNGLDGTMYFGTRNKGFFYFNPDELKDNLFIPPVYITGLDIFNHRIKYADGSNILLSQIEDTKAIKLNYDQNAVSFTFSALNYFHSEKNKYAYRLDGLDKRWTFTDAARHFANYTNLDPGQYTFMVKGSNNDGIWNPAVTSLKITISPPFWQTWWFKALYVLCAVMILYAIWYNRMQKTRDIKRIRNKIASDLHDDLGATLSSISIMSELVHQEIKGQSPLANSLLEKIGNSSRNMIDSVNDMVWTINPKNDNFENIIKRMKAFAAEILSAKDIALQFDVDKSLIQSKLKMDKRENFYLIFKEAVNNSAKYSRAANAFVFIQDKQNSLKMTIRDDGDGFEPHRITMGNGLNNMRYRAELMKARFSIKSVPGKGTTIELEFKNE